MGTTLGEEASYLEPLSASRHARDEADAASGRGLHPKRATAQGLRQGRRAKFALHLLV